MPIEQREGRRCRRAMARSSSCPSLGVSSGARFERRTSARGSGDQAQGRDRSAGEGSRASRVGGRGLSLSTPALSTTSHRRHRRHRRLSGADQPRAVIGVQRAGRQRAAPRGDLAMTSSWQPRGSGSRSSSVARTEARPSVSLCLISFSLSFSCQGRCRHVRRARAARRAARADRRAVRAGRRAVRAGCCAVCAGRRVRER